MNTDITTQLLSQLRDIHSPSTLSWWPLPPGWLAVALLALTALLWVGYCYRPSRKRIERRNSILQHLNRLKSDLILEEQYPLIYQDLSTLLRRIALMTHERGDVAHLTGDDWLNFLDAQCQTQLFSRDIGRLLLSAPYFPGNKSVANPEPLLKVTEEWVKRCV
ncbi:MAG: hypothetical protein K0R48_1093 [Gammaproteobacteria bacterium]|jgi:hypothetical protein|nr:hypothetical protein [Gammaproteobacteria bacterium]